VSSMGFSWVGLVGPWVQTQGGVIDPMVETRPARRR